MYTFLVALHNEVGKKGEQIAKNFLQSNGFQVLMTNVYFGKKEIDIISEKDNVVRLVEVKTTQEGSTITSEDNFTKDKLSHLVSVLRLIEKNPQFHGKRLQIDFLAISLNLNNRTAHCRLVQNIDTDMLGSGVFW